MAFTYTTLSQAIQDFVESDETTFVANLPIIIRQTEDRILKSVQLPDFRRNVVGTMTPSNKYLAIPTDFLAPYSLALEDSGNDQEFLLFKEVDFIRAAYPDPAVEGMPKYYAIFQDDYFLLGPTPDDNYPVELHYFYRPDSIVDAATSWLGTHAESALLYGCLLQAYTFLKGDSDLMGLYKEHYQEAMGQLKLLGEGRNSTDAYRIG